MGRGRAKAKQTKVARELKYSTHGTDLAALERELAAGGEPFPVADSASSDEDDGPVDDERWASSS